MNVDFIVVLASALAVVGNIPYVYLVIKKKVKPHPYTWFLWSVVSAVVFFGQVQKGAGIGAIPTFFSEIFTVIIFLLSLRYGFKNIDKRDTYFLIVALLGLIPWAFTHDPTISVITVVTIDAIAFVPTLRKTWQYPSTETPLLYAMNVLRHILTLFSLQAYNVATTLHSIVMILTNTLMTIFITKNVHKSN